MPMLLLALPVNGAAAPWSSGAQALAQRADRCDGAAQLLQCVATGLVVCDVVLALRVGEALPHHVEASGEVQAGWFDGALEQVLQRGDAHAGHARVDALVAVGL